MAKKSVEEGLEEMSAKDLRELVKVIDDLIDKKKKEGG